MMNKTTIIAEAGVNHNGTLALANKLIDQASNANVDFIKFQFFKTEDVISKIAPKAEYQKINNQDNQSQFDMVKKLELSEKSYLKIIKYCKKRKINFFSTAFDVSSFNFLKKHGQNICKVPSGEINNLPFLRFLGSQKLPIIMSTGMSTLKEIEFAINTLIKSGSKKNNITLMHCNTAYPTPLIDANVKAIITLKKNFDVNVGYSDHTLGIEASLAAVSLGATIIEKHFTVNKSLRGPDHKASLNFNELKQLVISIRKIEKSLGDGKKIVSKSELKNIDIARRSIVALKKIKKGTIFSDNNITTKRPGNGLSPIYWDKVIGKKSKFDFEKDDLIKI